jgi:hypothetical protein
VSQCPAQDTLVVDNRAASQVHVHSLLSWAWTCVPTRSCSRRRISSVVLSHNASTAACVSRLYAGSCSTASAAGACFHTSGVPAFISRMAAGGRCSLCSRRRRRTRGRAGAPVARTEPQQQVEPILLRGAVSSRQRALWCCGAALRRVLLDAARVSPLPALCTQQTIGRRAFTRRGCPHHDLLASRC